MPFVLLLQDNYIMELIVCQVRSCRVRETAHEGAESLTGRVRRSDDAATPIRGACCRRVGRAGQCHVRPQDLVSDPTRPDDTRYAESGWQRQAMGGRVAMLNFGVMHAGEITLADPVAGLAREARCPLTDWIVDAMPTPSPNSLTATRSLLLEVG